MVTAYIIYKRMLGVKFPGDYWDGPMTHEKALRRYLEIDDGQSTFRIVKETYEDVTPPKKRKDGQ